MSEYDTEDAELKNMALDDFKTCKGNCFQEKPKCFSLLKKRIAKNMIRKWNLSV
jgi:hypothetical protein